MLADEVLDWLAPRDGALYLDATLGLGGHSERILERSAMRRGRLRAASTRRRMRVFVFGLFLSARRLSQLVALRRERRMHSAGIAANGLSVQHLALLWISEL